MRKSNLFFAFIAVAGLFLLSLLFLHPAAKMPVHADRIEKTRRIVEKLGLTDLALFTEARYTRHVSVSDLHSAFQDHPVSLEHFPSGSFVMPPLIGLRETIR